MNLHEERNLPEESTRKVDVSTGEILEERGTPASSTGVAIPDAAKVPDLGQDTAIQEWGDQIVKLRLYAMRRTVVSLEDNKKAAEDLAIMKNLKKAIEQRMQEWLLPLREQEKTIRGRFALLLDPLHETIMATSGAMVSYVREQERIRQEQERIAELQRQANEAKIKLAKETQQTVVDLEVVSEPLAEAVPRKVTTGLGSSTMTGRWAWRWKEGISLAERMQKLPMVYHMANEIAIGQAVRAKGKTGITEADLGGVVEIYTEYGITSQGRK